MSNFDQLSEEFKKYNPLVFDISSLEKSDILDSSYDVLLSNNVSYPQLSLGFQHFIHKVKDKMVLTEKYANRKKIYLVTSLFEKNIDYKVETESGTKFTSINDGIESFVKEINPKLPPLLNRAFLKIWEMIVMFDLIPDTDNFTSSHLAEGPGSFIQATIYYREMLEKMGKIKSTSKDNYYGVTLHSDHEHLHMQKEFIQFFNKEKKDRLHVLETKSIKEIKDMYGGGHKGLITNGDLTKISTIKLFGGSKDVDAFAKPSDLVTADGGFDWKKENLQEQEAYRLIFSEIITAIKVQKDNGSFVVKIFESYTHTTLKMIELLRAFYKEIYICKPYTSRISNSEKYIVCKKFDKSKATQSVIKKLEDFIVTMNKNEQFNIIDIFTDFKISQKNLDMYKNINIQLMIRQYLGINNIILFDKLDNKNGIEYNEFLDKQIEASVFWNDLFLDTKNFSKLAKYIKNYKYFDMKPSYHTQDIENREETVATFEPESDYEVKSEESSEAETEKKPRQELSRSSKVTEKKNKSTKSTDKSTKSSSKSTKASTKSSSKTKANKSSKGKKSQKGGAYEIDYLNQTITETNDDTLDSLEEEQMGKLDSDSEDEHIDFNKVLV
jgi:23S rRNA U2552 (ribose-2'-O)-methylase RlmE/FtsJ